MFKIITIFSFVWFCALPIFSNSNPITDPKTDPVKEPKFFVTQAQKGEGVFSMLRRFELNNNPCNRAQFYILNEMNDNTSLVHDKVYKLPLMLFEYDGVSIRSTLGIDDWDKAVRIKEFNEYALRMNLRSKNYIESKELWVPYHEMFCDIEEQNSYKLPGVEEEGEFVLEPLFGTTNAKIKLIDHSLKNKVYYLVSGHGGPDPGARCTTCPNTLCEDEYAYDVVLRLAKNLMERGAIVHVVIQDKNDGIRSEQFLPCDKDESTIGGNPLPLNQIRRLEQRSKKINELYKTYKLRGIEDQYAIMVHVDSRSEEKRQDVFFYYYEHGSTSKSLALHMQETFKNKYDTYQKNRGYKGFVTSRNLYMIRNTYPTALYVELANIRNMADQKRILLPSNRQALADWLAEGLHGFK